MRLFNVVFRSAKELKNATFAERKATLISREMLGFPVFGSGAGGGVLGAGMDQ